jgi:hypothetical protein
MGVEVVILLIISAMDAGSRAYAIFMEPLHMALSFFQISTASKIQNLRLFCINYQL